MESSERDKIIRQCAAIAGREADLLLFTGARLRAYTTAGNELYYSEAELHDQAGTAIRVVQDKIMALLSQDQQQARET